MSIPHSRAVATPEDPNRAFAHQVVKRLRDAGYQALWAGGCVRDLLVARLPKDYDVATDARPEQVRHLFGRRQTLALGAAFGVISVRGPRGLQPVEVATFRQDAAYSDGRHPDGVRFCSAELDAQRRDFTINGLFYDPLENRLIDYVQGEQDLLAGRIRAIGNPRDRFREDHLRLLRAVRFTADFDFHMDPATRQALIECAPMVTSVSGERIAEEMRRMLRLPRRALAMDLLRQTGLLAVLLPEAAVWDAPHGDQHWTVTRCILDALAEPNFPVALAAMLRDLVVVGSDQSASTAPTRAIHDIGRRWRLANDEIQEAQWLIHNETIARQAQELPWPTVQRLLIQPHADHLVDLADAIARVLHPAKMSGVAFCRDWRQRPPEVLNPTPWLTGDDLIAHGLPPGPAFHSLLTAVRDAQLLGQIHNRDQALQLVDQLAATPPLDGPKSDRLGGNERV